MNKPRIHIIGGPGSGKSYAEADCVASHCGDRIDAVGRGRKRPSSVACRALFTVSLATAVSVFVSGCGVTLSPVKREPLQISAFSMPFTTNLQPIVLHFEDTLPNEPLSDTVWDNTWGAYADTNESRQIGYTQDYPESMSAMMVGGMPLAVAVATQPDYTRIVIPFGRIFENVFQSSLRNVYPNATIEPDNTSDIVHVNTPGRGCVLSLNIIEFQVWEHPLNHLNFNASIACKVSEFGKTGEPEFSYEVRDQATNQPIGSILTTSSGFIRNMNKVSNEFAATLSRKVLVTLNQKIQELNAGISSLRKPMAAVPPAAIAHYPGN